jgi:uncharacterized membrane protein
MERPGAVERFLGYSIRRVHLNTGFQEAIMAHSHILLGAGVSPAHPSIRRIGFADLKDALAKGVDDFMAMPTHAMFLCMIYPIIGLVLA